MDKKVWVKFEDSCRSISVMVKENADIDDVVTSALEKTRRNIPPDMVVVKFRDNNLQSDALVSDYQTKSDTPLLLLIETDEGM